MPYSKHHHGSNSFHDAIVVCRFVRHEGFCQQVGGLAAVADPQVFQQAVVKVDLLETRAWLRE